MYCTVTKIIVPHANYAYSLYNSIGSFAESIGAYMNRRYNQGKSIVWVKPNGVCWLACVYFLFSITGNLSAQQAKQIVFIGDSIKNKEHFFISEVHGIYESPYFEYAAITYFNEVHHTSNIILETGASGAYLCNRYMRNGDTTLLKYFAQSARTYLVMLKKYNDLPGTVDKLNFYGIDFEAISSFVPAVQLILNNSTGNKAVSTELYKFINGLPDTTYLLGRYPEKLAERTKIYNEAKRMFGNEETSLEGMLKPEDFSVLKRIFENPSSEKHFQKRDKRMLVNLNRQGNLKNERFVCILGGHHLNADSKKSFLNKYLRAEPRSNNALITTVCKNCYAAIRYRRNYHYDVVGPENITGNDSVMSLAYNRYFASGKYSLINQYEFKNAGVDANPSIDVYYMFFRDQPEQ